MGNSTLKSKVVYGTKAVAEKKAIKCSTSVSIDGQIEIKMNYSRNNTIGSGFHKVNILDKRRRNAYRKINKMIGGC